MSEHPDLTDGQKLDRILMILEGVDGQPGVLGRLTKAEEILLNHEKWFWKIAGGLIVVVTAIDFLTRK